MALLGLGACARTEPPAPVDVKTVSRSPQAPPGASAPAAALPGARDTAYVVQRGDTAYAVSRRFDVPVKAIIDANNLQPPYGIQAGQRLVIPRPRGHLVEPGDTVASVARRYGVDQSALVRVNELQPPYALQPGQRLALPAPIASATPTQDAAAAPPIVPATAPPASARAVEVASLPPPPRAVPSGAPPAGPGVAGPSGSAPAASAAPALRETPTAAPRDQAAASAAAARQAAPPPAAAAAPDSADKPVEKAADNPAPATASSGAGAQQLAAIAPPLAAAVAPAAPPVESVVAAPAPRDTTPVGPPPPRAGKSFLWPLRGRVIATFGEQGHGLHNDGLNIAAPRGTPIRAAENGVVVYSGNEIRGFGNLLLIRHAGGYVTAYAHADSLMVKRGDTVHRGQTIARVGATGSVTEPQLHFEIREGSQPVDPQRYLGSPSA